VEPVRANRKHRQAGVSLMEMLVVVVLISLMIGIAVPSFQAGLPAIRLRSASTSIAQFLSAARNQVERRQLPVLVTISPEESSMQMQTIIPMGMAGMAGVAAPAVESLQLPDGVTIRSVFPAMPGREAEDRQFLLFPGGSVPALAIGIRNARGASRWVSLDPITHVPLIAESAPVTAMDTSGGFQEPPE
jgi:prepilin-type N-terminal cleavage/methylation domain-containing protein